MKIILCIVFLLYTGTQFQLEIGQNLGKEVKIIDHSKLILAGPASITKAYTILYNSCKYDVVLGTDKTITSIFAIDKKFATPDEIKVGMFYKNIKAKLPERSQLVPGWARYYSAAFGWKIAFAFDAAISDSSRVQFIFKSANFR